MQTILQQILEEQTWPLELKAFVFEKKIKNMFRY